VLARAILIRMALSDTTEVVETARAGVILRAMLDHLGTLVLFAAVMCLTPGPNVVLATASAVNFGFRRTVPQISGVTAGFGMQVLAAGLGLAALFQAEPRLNTALKYAGAAYLLNLAWRIATAVPAGGSARARPLGFVEGVLVTWVNPRGWVTTIGALAAFTTVDGNPWQQTAVIALVLAVACGASLLLWAGFGAAIGRWLARPGARRAFNGAMAALLMLSLVPVFVWLDVSSRTQRATRGWSRRRRSGATESD
jgi:threonine/homoserine/homoserine lactone efflux protein